MSSALQFVFPLRPVLLAVAAVGLSCTFAGGCSMLRTAPAERARALPTQDAREAPLFNGRSGSPMTWNELIEQAMHADAIIIGEEHDDARGHAVQRAIVEDLFDGTGPGGALSMEMLDRSEQWIADDYIDGIIDRERFIEETASTRWRSLAKSYAAGEIERDLFLQRILAPGWPDWEMNYQPIIDAAKERGGRLVAANAPWARYTSMIDLESGYARLEMLSAAQRELIDWPQAVPTGRYRERFWEVMAQRKEGEAPPEAPAEDDPGSPVNPHARQMTDEEVLAGFMKQLLYDATMAQSLAAALSAGSAPVVHLVGQFHSDFEGGTVAELRRRSPGARILTISMQPGNPTSLREEDLDRADIVVYTGGRQAP